MKLGDYLAANALAIQSAGTSEGASKGWDSRGRGRHPEAGSFQKASSSHAYGTKDTIYRTHSGGEFGAHVKVHEKGDGAVHVTHADGRTNRDGNPGSADTALAG